MQSLQSSYTEVLGTNSVYIIGVIIVGLVALLISVRIPPNLWIKAQTDTIEVGVWHRYQTYQGHT